VRLLALAACIALSACQAPIAPTEAMAVFVPDRAGRVARPWDAAMADFRKAAGWCWRGGVHPQHWIHSQDQTSVTVMTGEQGLTVQTIITLRQDGAGVTFATRIPRVPLATSVIEATQTENWLAGRYLDDCLGAMYLPEDHAKGEAMKARSFQK
jgi:hypothetical protein